MRTANEIMTAKVITATVDMDVSAAARLMLDNKINGLPVVDETQAVIGIICQSDLVAQQKKISIPSFFTLFDGMFPISASKDLDREIEKIAALTVGQAMTPEAVTLTLDSPIDEIATIMAERKLYTLPVVNEGRLVGVVGKEDILKIAFSQ